MLAPFKSLYPTFSSDLCLDISRFHNGYALVTQNNFPQFKSVLGHAGMEHGQSKLGSKGFFLPYAPTYSQERKHCRNLEADTDAEVMEDAASSLAFHSFPSLLP